MSTTKPSTPVRKMRTSFCEGSGGGVAYQTMRTTTIMVTIKAMMIRTKYRISF